MCSGLKLNITKTELIPIGTSLTKPNIKTGVLSNVTINNINGPFKALDIWFSNDPEPVTNLNFNDRLG